ncbi:MAG: NAD-dependent succinate-semialdehyde dehydrogenase [Idiomarina sp.]|nr:NAD-dependent succinate-semialdehyde dehydrogenase [Idiomarina sp.]
MAVSQEIKKWIREACFVNGSWVGASSSETFAVTNPSTGEEIARVPNFGKADTEHAIASAHTAWAEWRRKTAGERSQLLRAWFDAMMAERKSLAALMTFEQGKPLAEAEGEITYAANYIEWFAEEAKRMYGETIPGASADSRIVVTREPVGVCVAITPWNFPAAMITRKVAPALAAGCTIVVKPASETPLTALAMAVLAERVGIPAGVFNVVTGSAKVIGEVMTQSPLVRKLSFTGSTKVGATLMAASASTVKRVSLELGGNAPFIVFDDADLDAAVQGAIDSKFRNAGQTCVCANRIYVQRSVYEGFLTRLANRLNELKVGDGFEEGVKIGPLINQAAVDKVEEHIADALAQGGTLLKGGQRHARGGLFFTPTIIRDAHQGMLCAREETFGPVAPIFPFDDEAEAIAWANDTEFGLAAYFYAQNIGRVQRVAEQLEAGMIGVNTGLVSNATAPFGGVKQSGIGREGGHQGLEEYTEWKYLCFGSLSTD